VQPIHGLNVASAQDIAVFSAIVQRSFANMGQLIGDWDARNGPNVETLHFQSVPVAQWII
jgi:hypothetical protein